MIITALGDPTSTSSTRCPATPWYSTTTRLYRGQEGCYANPHLYGMNGMVADAERHGIPVLVTMDETTGTGADRIRGIAGDRQHINGLSGLHILLKEGTRRGFIERCRDRSSQQAT